MSAIGFFIAKQRQRRLDLSDTGFVRHAPTRQEALLEKLLGQDYEVITGD